MSETPETRVQCTSCLGRGFHVEPRDLHRSGGVSKCDYCKGTGKIAPSEPREAFAAIEPWKLYTKPTSTA